MRVTVNKAAQTSFSPVTCFISSWAAPCQLRGAVCPVCPGLTLQSPLSQSCKEHKEAVRPILSKRPKHLYLLLWTSNKAIHSSSQINRAFHLSWRPRSANMFGNLISASCIQQYDHFSCMNCTTQCLWPQINRLKIETLEIHFFWLRCLFSSMVWYNVCFTTPNPPNVLSFSCVLTHV